MEAEGNEAQRPQEPTGRARKTTWDCRVPHVKCHLPTPGAQRPRKRGEQGAVSLLPKPDAGMSLLGR